MDGIAPVTFSERPPAVEPKSEPAAAATPPAKEVDPTPSGPVRSETPLSAGPETFDPVTSFEPVRRGPNWILIAAAAAAVLVVGYWIQRGSTESKSATPAPQAEATSQAAAEGPKLEAPAVEATKPAEPAAVAEPQPAESAAESGEKAPEAKASAEGAVEAAPSASADSPPTAAEGTMTVSVATRPPGARVFYRGKEVGTTPFTLEHPVGQTRRYEVGLPGYTTRKLVVDGTKSEIVLGLRPEEKKKK